jgi:hypothetical protein
LCPDRITIVLQVMDRSARHQRPAKPAGLLGATPPFYLTEPKLVPGR